MVNYNSGPVLSPAEVLDFTGDNGMGLYGMETTQRFNYGTRCLTEDGRVFYYAKSSGACYTGRMNTFDVAIDDTGLDWVSPAAATVVGARQITLTESGTAAIAEDALVNGFAMINYDAGSDNNDLMVRRITGNTACASAGTTILDLDGPLDIALTVATSKIFAMASPWSSVKLSGGYLGSHCGVAAAYVAATGYFHWEQTWGPCWITDFAATLGHVNDSRQLVVNNAGQVAPHDAATVMQHAGFIMDNNETDNGMSLVCLQIMI